MPRLKAPSFVKTLGGRQSSGYDGLESEAPLAAAGATSPDKESAQGSPFNRSAAEQEKPLQEQGESEHAQASVADGTTAASGAQSKAGKSKKPWKGIGGKLRMGRSKISTWEESETGMLQTSPVTSPVTSPIAEDGRSFVGPFAAAAAQLGDTGQPGTAVAVSAAVRSDQQQQPGSKPRHELAAAASMFAAHRGAELQQGTGAGSREQQQQRAGVQVPRAQGDQGGNRARTVGSTSADCEPENDDTFSSGADTGAASNSSAGRKPSSEVTGEQKAEHQPDGASSKKGRKLKLRLNLKSSLKRLSNDLSRALKRSDGLNAQVTMATPPAAAGDSRTATPPLAVAAFKNVGGSLSGEDVKHRVGVAHTGAGYNALNASYNEEENSTEDDDADDDVDETSQPHVVTRMTLSAHAPLRDGGFRPL